MIGMTIAGVRQEAETYLTGTLANAEKEKVSALPGTQIIGQACKKEEEDGELKEDVQNIENRSEDPEQRNHNDSKKQSNCILTSISEEISE